MSIYTPTHNPLSKQNLLKTKENAMIKERMKDIGLKQKPQEYIFEFDEVTK